MHHFDGQDIYLSMFCFLQVDVTILDLNDNLPIFEFPAYPITLFENIAPFSSIDTLLATDADVGSNAQISYAIVSGNTSGKDMVGMSSCLLA